MAGPVVDLRRLVARLDPPLTFPEYRNWRGGATLLLSEARLFTAPELPELRHAKVVMPGDEILELVMAAVVDPPRPDPWRWRGLDEAGTYDRVTDSHPVEVRLFGLGRFAGYVNLRPGDSTAPHGWAVRLSKAYRDGDKVFRAGVDFREWRYVAAYEDFKPGAVHREPGEEVPAP